MRVVTKIVEKLLRQVNIDMKQFKHKFKEIPLPDTWPTKESPNRKFIAFESNQKLFLRPLNEKKGYLLTEDLLYTLAKRVYNFSIDMNKISRTSSGAIESVLRCVLNIVEKEKESDENNHQTN